MLEYYCNFQVLIHRLAGCTVSLPGRKYKNPVYFYTYNMK